jgi:hypothetical protein
VVDYTTVNETAIAGADYSQTSGVLSWGEGDSSPKVVSVPITAAGVGKEFALTLVSISGAADFGTPTSAKVMISSGSDDGSAASSSSSGSSSNGSSSGGSSSDSSAASTAPQTGLALSCPTATATVQFAACPGGKLVYAVPADGVYVESSTVATTTVPDYSAATHVFQPYQKAVEVVVCKIAETPGLTVTYSTDPCTMDHGVVAGPAAAGSSSSSNKSSSSSSSSGGSSSHSSSGATSSSSSSSSGGSSSSSHSSSSSSSSGGSSSSGSDVPPAAAAVGYKTLTFGPAVTLNGNWFPWNFYSQGAQPKGAESQNSDGSLSIAGFTTKDHDTDVGTARQSDTAKGWTGTAFGGGAYFEAVLSFTGQGTAPYLNGGPAFWALDVEHASQGPYNVGWPGMPKNSSGEVYDDFFEVDFMQFDVSAYAYQNGVGNWYGYPSSVHSTSNPYQGVHDSAGSILIPNGTDFSQFHKVGCLWVPATPSTQGYLKFYFDDVQTGSPTFYWNYYDPNDASTYPAPPPVNGSTAMSGMDWRHMLLILGTGTNQPMTVQSVSVWQASDANNLKE